MVLFLGLSFLISVKNCLTSSKSTQKKTLLERIGGVKALHTAVDMFYDTMMADNRVNHYFKNTNMAHQRQQQKDFLQTVLGNQTSDNVYKGQNMLDAHKNLKVTNAAFDATVENLVNTLVKCGVDKDTLGEIGPIVESLRGDIVIDQPKKTLLERIGGVKALHAAVDMFYDTMMADNRVNHYFKNTNMVHQRQQQKDFLQTVLGNQTSDSVYKGQNMLDAHKHLNVTNAAFDATAENLVNTLIKCGVDQATLGEIGPIVESLRADIVIEQPKKTLLERIGGVKSLHAAVDMFYDTMMADNRVNHYFKNTNMAHQRQQQKDFLQTVLGNQTTDSVYKGQNMLDAHKHLKVTNAAFDATAENLVNTLVKCGVDQATLGEIAPIVESLRGDVVDNNLSLLDKIGGKQALYIAVDKFYDRVEKDERVNHFFKNTNMQHQRQQQKDFLEMVLGGDNNYKGKDMVESHKHLGCNDKAFDDIVDILTQTLSDVGVQQQYIDEIGLIIETLRNDIVTVKNQPNSLYNRIGKKRLYGSIDIFYDRCLTNPKISHYFKNQDIQYLRQHQKQFLRQAFGGYNEYQGKSMKDAHKNLNIQEDDFNEMGSIFELTLRDLSINKQDTIEAKQIWDQQKEFIINQ